ncbi:MAG: hypothetical protein R6X25_04795 [Candidatus Krumholzibacteriia bacterium]
MRRSATTPDDRTSADAAGLAHPSVLARPALLLRRSRRLPIAGEVLVSAGDRVEPGTVVARAAAGTLLPVNVARQLDVDASTAAAAVLVAPGAVVVRGQPLARLHGLAGWLGGQCRSPADGTVREVSPHTGQVLLEVASVALELMALLGGRVVEVAEGRGVDIVGRATLVQGIVGVGGEVVGELAAAVSRHDAVLTSELIGPELAGKVVLGGALVTGSALRRAAAVGVGALITGGVDDADLAELLGHELSVAVTGHEVIRPTLVVTGGFGRVPQDPRAFAMLNRRLGSPAGVRAATRVRAGAQRPEILVSEPDDGGCPADSIPAVGGDARAGRTADLRPGQRVRLIGATHLGRIGVVAGLPPGRHTFSGGGRHPAVEVQVPGGRTLIVPRANVELLDAPGDDGG